MFAVRRLSLVPASAIAALALALPAAAQSKSGSSTGKNKKSTPPSSTALPATATTGASPLSWVEDASLLAPGSMALTISAMRWSGADLSEVDAPIVDASLGLTRRFQIGATVPHVVGSPDGAGPVGGLGTSYISGKIALLTGSEVKLSASPLVEILGEGAVQSLAPGESRYQAGLPVSLEVAQGPVRIFAATGFFTRGAWFAGGGTGFQLTPKMAASMSLTRSWAKTDVDGVHRDRRELSGGISYFVKEQIAVYGSAGRTVATTDENGAGTSVSGGVTFFVAPAVNK